MPCPLVSVIIPVYNAEAYLPACLDSLERQDCPQMEILLVDDGSRDASPALCRDFARGRPHVRLLRQKNQGPGPARNAGLAQARGQYVLFLDADDQLDGPQAVSRLVALARSAGADIAVGGYRRLTGGVPGPVVPPAFTAPPEEACARSVDFRFRCFFVHTSTGFLWGKLYRRAFLTENALLCSAHGFLEDKYLNLCCCACGARYAFLGDSVYLYRRNQSSITSQYLPRMAETWSGMAHALDSFLAARGLSQEYGDLAAFHRLMGFLALEGHLREFGRGLPSRARALKEYARDPAVSQAARDLCRGAYIRELHSPSWRLGVWGAAALVRCHGWFLLAAGAALLNRPRLTRRLQRGK